MGAIASIIPSICGMLLKEWTPYDKDVNSWKTSIT